MRVTELPGAIVPQVRLVRLWVQAESENTPTLGEVVMVPEVGTSWFMVIAA